MGKTLGAPPLPPPAVATLPDEAPGAAPLPSPAVRTLPDEAPGAPPLPSPEGRDQGPLRPKGGERLGLLALEAAGAMAKGSGRLHEVPGAGRGAACGLDCVRTNKMATDETTTTTSTCTTRQLPALVGAVKTAPCSSGNRSTTHRSRRPRQLLVPPIVVCQKRDQTLQGRLNRRARGPRLFCISESRSRRQSACNNTGRHSLIVATPV